MRRRQRIHYIYSSAVRLEPDRHDINSGETQEACLVRTRLHVRPLAQCIERAPGRFDERPIINIGDKCSRSTRFVPMNLGGCHCRATGREEIVVPSLVGRIETLARGDFIGAEVVDR